MKEKIDRLLEQVKDCARKAIDFCRSNYLLIGIILAVLLLIFLCIYPTVCFDENSSGNGMILHSKIGTLYENKTIVLDFSYGVRSGEYSGTVNDKGKPDGYGVFSSENEAGQHWIYEGDWLNGHWDGYGKTSWDSGAAYYGFYQNDVYSGFGTYFSSDGERYEGYYVEGELVGPGTLYFEDGTFFKGTFTDTSTAVGTYYAADNASYDATLEYSVLHYDQSSTPDESITTTTDTTTTTTTAAPVEYWYEGTHKVGVDIPAGDYIIFANSRKTKAYMCISKDGNQDDIIENDNFLNRVYVTLIDGQYITINRGHAISISDGTPTDTSDVLGDGMYKVGYDIPAGEYRISVSPGNDMGYWCVYDRPLGKDCDIVSNDNFGGNAYVTVRDGQYLYLSRSEVSVEQ